MGRSLNSAFSVLPQLDTVFCKRVKKIKRRKTHTGISSSSSTHTQPTLPESQSRGGVRSGQLEAGLREAELQNSVVYYRS